MVSVNKHEKLYKYISLVIFYLFVFFSVLNFYIISTIEMEYQLLYTTVDNTETMVENTPGQMANIGMICVN